MDEILILFQAGMGERTQGLEEDDQTDMLRVYSILFRGYIKMYKVDDPKEYMEGFFASADKSWESREYIDSVS